MLRTAAIHAPTWIGFKIGEDARDALLGYDDLGRMTRIGSRGPEQEKIRDHLGQDHPILGLLSNRAMAWDAGGRLSNVRGVADGASPANDNLLREEYVYNSGGNRALKIDRPTDVEHPRPVTVYMTPFYARPFDGRGTVQLSPSNLPAASLAAPANGSDVPTATYLFADLPAGSMTASVTTLGEPSDAKSSIVGRREYAPFGLELTAGGSENATAPTAFQGKELDRNSNFSTFGARYYSRDIGGWLTPDLMLPTYLGSGGGAAYENRNFASYQFAWDNPIDRSDSNGLSVEKDNDSRFGSYKEPLFPDLRDKAGYIRLPPHHSTNSVNLARSSETPRFQKG